MNIPSIVKSASVKVMRSFDYCHFEASMTLENDNGINTIEVDQTRKTCQRLVDKAVGQYKKAKEELVSISNKSYQKQAFERDCKAIEMKDEQDRTVREIAMLKQYKDSNWQAEYDRHYDYEDDDQYNIPF